MDGALTVRSTIERGVLVHHEFSVLMADSVNGEPRPIVYNPIGAARMTAIRDPRGRTRTDPCTDLADVLSGALDADVTVCSLAPLTSGASRQTWRFEMTVDGTRRAGIVQYRADPGPAAVQGFSTSVHDQARILRLAARAGVPVPPVLAWGDRTSRIDVPYLVTERLPGEALPQRLLRDSTFEHAMVKLHGQCAHAIGALHALPSDEAALPTVDPLSLYRDVLDAVGEPHPVLEWCYRWLDAHRPTSTTTVPVHGDFRLGNLLVGAKGLHAVLDWELAHLGDPYEDLAWPLVRAWRFDHLRRAGAFPTARSWVQAVIEVTGREVDLAVLRWWVLACTFKWGVICLAQWQRHRDGAVWSTELTAIGRRVAETELDLLDLVP